MNVGFSFYSQTPHSRHLGNWVSRGKECAAIAVEKEHCVRLLSHTFLSSLACEKESQSKGRLASSCLPGFFLRPEFTNIWFFFKHLSRDQTGPTLISEDSIICDGRTFPFDFNAII